MGELLYYIWENLLILVRLSRGNAKFLTFSKKNCSFLFALLTFNMIRGLKKISASLNDKN